MVRVYLDTINPTQQAPKKRVYLDTQKAPVPAQPKQRIYLDTPKPQPQRQSAFNWTMNQLVKPVAMASNALEDTGKLIAGLGVTPFNGKSLSENLNKVGFDPIKHQLDVLKGENKRTYSDIAKEIGNEQQNPVLRNAIKTVGYGGDFLLDPLNKVKVAGLTAKGLAAEKTGKLALSAAEQTAKGERALLQLGKYNVLPSVGNKILSGTTKVNELLRATKAGAKLANVGAAVSGKIRPAGVSREEFKVLTDAKTAARNTTGYLQDKAVEFAKGISKTLTDRKATDAERAQLLHAIEKGRESLAPVGLQDLWKAGVDFKAANEATWAKLGGSVLEGHGLSHVATKEVAEAARKDAFKGQGGFKLTSTKTPQDIHRQWVRVTPVGRKGELKVGDFVKAGDRGNFGRIMSTDGDKAIVKFTNKAEGTTANVELSLNDLKNSNAHLVEPTIVNLKDTGIEYGKLQKNKFNLNNILESAVNELRNPGKKPVLGSVNKFTPEEIIASAKKELSGVRKNASDIPLNRKEVPYQMSTNRPATLKTDNLKNVYHKGQQEFKVEQASAMEINNALVAQGKNPIFQEDLPIVAAKMGISTGRKQAATDFLKATEGLKSEEAKALAAEVHDKMVNPESLRKAIQGFDAIQNIWKAQALVAPSYHIRNIAGNLWNNYLADVQPAAYAMAGNLQQKMARGALSAAEKKVVQEMEQHGVIGTGQYLGDIAQAVDSRIGKTSINPFSQNFAGYKLNKFIGGGVEDNAKIAHYLSKRAEGYGVKQAAESVKKYLFDYGDLTDVEKGVLKRIMPFYTWTSKNIPLQVQQFVQNPSKFSKIAIAKKDIEQGVPQPNEKYMSDYISGNAPIRVKTDENGNTMYFLAGAWLPAAQALTFLSDPVSNALGMVTPALKLPYENLTGKGTFFKNTLGQYEDIQKYPGQKTSYLGLDLNPQTVNNLRSIRALNELNNLNPGGIFGGKNSPSIFQGILPNASNVRGGQHTPETTQFDRASNAIIGKLQGYNPEQSKTYYDRDTQDRINQYNADINRALNNNQTDLAASTIKELEQFVQERNGQPTEALKMYNLIGDQYFKDQAANKMAEKNRTNIRDEMKKQIRQGLQTNNTDLIKQALAKDPTYAKQALTDAIKEQQQMTDEQQKLMYQYNQAKTRLRLNPFYTP